MTNNPALLLALEALKPLVEHGCISAAGIKKAEAAYAALSELAQVEPVAWSTIADDHPYKRLTDLKTADIASRGYEVTGYVLRNGDDNVCISECSAVRWMNAKEMFSMMHPESQAVSQEGWKLVPLCPDVDMIEAAALANKHNNATYAQIYQAMIDAAPIADTEREE